MQELGCVLAFFISNVTCHFPSCILVLCCLPNSEALPKVCLLDKIWLYFQCVYVIYTSKYILFEEFYFSCSIHCSYLYCFFL